MYAAVRPAGRITRLVRPSVSPSLAYDNFFHSRLKTHLFSMSFSHSPFLSRTELTDYRPARVSEVDGEYNLVKCDRLSRLSGLPDTL